MALPRFLQLIGGVFGMGVPVASSTGTAQASSIVATNTNGYVDPSLVPTVAVTGGTIDNAVLGGTTPAAGTFTGMTATGTTGQILGACNAAWQYPDFAFRYSSGCGMYWTGNTIAFVCGSSTQLLAIYSGGSVTVNASFAVNGASTLAAVTASGLISGSAGLTISAGTAALKATTCTTLTASGVATSVGQVAAVQVLTTATTLTAASQEVAINAAVTATLPSAPTVGQKIRLVNLTSAAVTIAGNGKNITFGAAAASSLSLAAYAQVSLTYFSAAAGWA